MEVQQTRVAIFSRQHNDLRGRYYVEDCPDLAALAHGYSSVGRNGISQPQARTARTSIPRPTPRVVCVRRYIEIAGSIGVCLIDFCAAVIVGRLLTSAHEIPAHRGVCEAASRLRCDR